MATAKRIVINIRDVAGERESKEARKTVSYGLIALGVLMVLFGGLFPFDFDFRSGATVGAIQQRFDLSTAELWTTPQSWEKFIFYIPFGFTLRSILWVWPGKRAKEIAIRCGIAAGCAAGISTLVEISQVFLSRDPSLADVISKTSGSLVGFGLFALVGEPAVRMMVRALLALRRIRDARVFAAWAIVWLLIAVVAPITARNIGSLRSWNTAYPLIIGNDTDGVRHWDGTVSNVWLSAAAASDDQLDSALVATDPGHLLGTPLVMDFHLNGVGPYADASGHTSALVWTANFHRGATAGTTQPANLTGIDAIGRVGVPISEGWWLSTGKAGASDASRRIAEAQAFTLLMDFQCHDLDHGFGWPHIFSISQDAESCNLQLLQDHQDLQVRLRSAASGDSGADPEFIVPGIFVDTLPQRLLVSYDHGRLLVESSKIGERFTLQFLPDAWLVWRMFPSSFWHFTMNSEGQLVASGIYRVMAMLPIGLLIGAMLRVLRQRSMGQNAPLIFIGSVCGAIAILETVLHFAAGVPFSIFCVIAGIFAACVGTFVIQGSVPWRRQWV